MIETLWFCLVALMLTMYVVLDGFDLGVGALHRWLARDDRERRTLLRSIGPVWDGNEVWLLAAGGTLFFAFPRLYATAFSGFYLPLIIVLWLLILRAIALEFRHLVDASMWTGLWDVVFSGASLLLIVFFGAALGNVVRGVPLDERGQFFEPLWTDLTLGAERGIIDWFTLLVGVAATATLLSHGALWIVLKTEGALQRRARMTARRLWWFLLGSTLVLTAAALAVQPQILVNLRTRPWGAIFPALALAGLAGIRWSLGRVGPASAPHGDAEAAGASDAETREGPAAADLWAFLSSCAYVGGMMTSAAFGLYPYVLPSGPHPERSLTLWEAASSPYALRVGLVWWVPGMLLVTAYFVHAYRQFAGKVRLDEPGY